MNSRRLVAALWWLGTFGTLAGIVLVYRRWLHVNPTTVALTLVLFVLVVAAQTSLRYAVAASVAAAACYNFYFPAAGRHLHHQRSAELARAVCISGDQRHR